MTKIQTFLLVAFFSSFTFLATANERWETLRAINMVENPTNQTGYGSKGELGPYQFRSSTWRMYSSKPFRMANDRTSADQVAVQQPLQHSPCVELRHNGRNQWPGSHANVSLR